MNGTEPAKLPTVFKWELECISCKFVLLIFHERKKNWNYNVLKLQRYKLVEGDLSNLR